MKTRDFCSFLTLLATLAAKSFAAAATQPTTFPAQVPVPLLSPEEQLKTFKIVEGFRAEVVAAEPMIEHPVAIAFDPDGRLFVAEMRNYMPDVDGWREEKPTGRVSVLEDIDGDGRMDKSTVFLDKLVLPRAVGFANGGVLIGSPPKLLFCKDNDGDAKADIVETVATDFGIVENPENSANGLIYNLDNWIYNADYTRRMRFQSGKLVFDPVPDMGQFGLTRDDYGRLFFNTNSDHLRGTLIPPHYSPRNPHSFASLADKRIAQDQTVWPANASTVNRGYRDGFLRPDGTLKEFTAACGPVIYRANLFGSGFYGNAFTCEATSNLVHRSILAEKDVMLTAEPAYKDREFLASTYERFRPVNLTVGPEGALYVVDMHHGIIQHKISITDYAKDQYKKKQLNKHLLTGRIFRIVPDAGAPPARPRLSRATTTQLVDQLTHPNAWWRETAQRLLVEKNDPASVEPLKQLAHRDPDPVHRMIALWTLDGMQRLDDETLKIALSDKDAKVRANAIRLCEDRDVDAELLARLDEPDAYAKTQLVLTLSARKLDDAIAIILRDAGDDYKLREAAVTGLAGRELALIAKLISDPAWADDRPGRGKVFTDIGRSITRRDDPKEMVALVELIGEQPPERKWQQLALLEAIPVRREDGFGPAKPIVVATQPAAIERLRSASSESLRKRAARVEALFVWPGKPMPPRPPVVPLTPKQQELFELGRQQFALVCAQCHQPTGLGQEGKAPPLVNSPWALGPESRLVRIVLHGMRGPVQVGDKVFNMDMPALKAMSDEQIAGVLTYIRRSWGHEAPPVDPATVAGIRDWTQAKKDGWLVSELMHHK